MAKVAKTVSKIYEWMNVKFGAFNINSLKRNLLIHTFTKNCNTSHFNIYINHKLVKILLTFLSTINAHINTFIYILYLTERDILC